MGDREELQALRRLAELEAKVQGVAPQQSQSAQAQRAPSSAYRTGAKAAPELRDSIAQLQGPTFGFLDEIAGGVVGGVKTAFNNKPFAQNYADVRDYVRGAADAGMQANPVRNMAGQMVLSAPIGVIGAVKAGLGPLAQYAAGAGLGGLSGFIGGLGESKETEVGPMLADAAKSAAIAAAIPAVLMPFNKGVGAVASNVKQRFSDSAAADYAKRKVAEAFVRDNPNITNAAAKAARTLDKLGPEARVVDAGGASTRGLLDVMATLPGESKQAVEAAIRTRQASRAGRMIGEAERAMGTGGIRLAPTVEDWMQERAKAAAPLYKQLHAMTVPASDELSDIIDIAKRHGFTTLAAKMADYDQVPFTLSDKTAKAVSARDVDYIKRAMDSAIPALRDPKTGAATAEGRSLVGLRNKLVEQMDSATGGLYARARDAWAGPSQAMEAARLGREALTKDDATISGLRAGMTASEKDAFALGAFEALRAKLATRSGQTQITELWREKGLQEKLKAIFGDERAYREFASRVAAEARMKGLEGIGRGSQTAARQYGAGDLDMQAGIDAGAALADAKSGNVLGVIAKGAKAWNRVATPEPVRDAMGRILLSRGADGRNALLDMGELAKQIRQTRAMQAGAYGLAGGAAGNALMNLADTQLQRDLNPLLH